MASSVEQNNGSAGVDLGDSYRRRTSSGTYDPSRAEGINNRLHLMNEMVAARLKEQDENQSGYHATEEGDPSICEKAGDCFRHLFSKNRKNT